jgi:cell division cycle protein 20 (cofactor of APC complex)
MTKASDIADFESMLSLDNPIKSNILPRWQRKQLAEKRSESDRFIPNRSSTDLETSQNSFIEDKPIVEADDSEHKKMIAARLTGQDQDGSGPQQQPRVLSYKNKAPAPKDGYQNSLTVLYSQSGSKKGELVKPVRHIPSLPVKILDAPDMLDE